MNLLTSEKPTSKTKQQFLDYLGEKKLVNNFKNPIMILSINTSEPEPGKNHTTLDHYLFMNKEIVEKRI